MSLLEEITALKPGESLPAEEVIRLRSMGMAAVRKEFIGRLIRSSAGAESLHIYWERGHQAVYAGEVEDVARKLVCGYRKRVIGEFQDLFLLCYPCDSEVKQVVEREIDRMVEAVVALAAE